MSEYFEVERKKRYKPTKEESAIARRKHMGKPLSEIMNVPKPRVFIENNRMKSNRFYWANKK